MNTIKKRLKASSSKSNYMTLRSKILNMADNISNCAAILKGRQFESLANDFQNDLGDEYEETALVKNVTNVLHEYADKLNEIAEKLENLEIEIGEVVRENE